MPSVAGARYWSLWRDLHSDQTHRLQLEFQGVFAPRLSINLLAHINFSNV
jgi:hypothetical protein